MIELLTLEKEQQIKIRATSEPFNLQIKRSTYFLYVHKEVTKLLNVGSKYDNEVWCLVTAISKTLRYGGDFFNISLKPVRYSEANKKYKQKLSYKKMLELLPLLEELGLITLYKGYYLHEEDYCKSSIKPLQPLINLFSELPVSSEGASRGNEEEVVIRDLKGKQVTGVKPKGIGQLKQDMKDYNNMLSGHTVKVGDYSCSPCYRRIFSEKITLAGRVYSCGGFQSLPSKLRPTITIDGQRTVEVDIKCLHPNLIACHLGINLPEHFEPYKVEQGLVQGGYEDIRGLCKKFFMSLLYCENLKKAERSCGWFTLNQIKQSVDDRDYPTVNYDVLCPTDVVNSLLKTNHRISEVLLSNSLYPGSSSLLWQQLQYLDSSILMNVINTFTALDKPLLPYHDSAVVKQEDEQLLVDTFREAWWEVLGTHDNLVLTRAF